MTKHSEDDKKEKSHFRQLLFKHHVSIVETKIESIKSFKSDLLNIEKFFNLHVVSKEEADSSFIDTAKRQNSKYKNKKTNHASFMQLFTKKTKNY
ncbi:hypothetical protein BpHYR1_035207 [Brachionus plicatilis]|uniref:Uncharacterized protein n=1 Tax=Brachionus plicatilis TaxID=10195 RepID=A0A3M7T939_BRAPC|nr:hypothetical protein BpHYR1_035207 [Brachionus plicatilis]